MQIWMLYQMTAACPQNVFLLQFAVPGRTHHRGRANKTLIKQNNVFLCCHSQSLGALITVDVHNRDIIENLIETKVTKASEFGWQMQLRYEYDLEAEQVSILQVNAR